MARVGEVDPGFGDVVGDEAGERGARQPFDVIAHVIPQRRLRQPGEVSQDSRACTGNFFIDDEVLRQAGVTDFTQYAVDPEAELLPDFFV